MLQFYDSDVRDAKTLKLIAFDCVTKKNPYSSFIISPLTMNFMKDYHHQQIGMRIEMGGGFVKNVTCWEKTFIPTISNKNIKNLIFFFILNHVSRNISKIINQKKKYFSLLDKTYFYINLTWRQKQLKMRWESSWGMARKIISKKKKNFFDPFCFIMVSMFTQVRESACVSVKWVRERERKKAKES